MDTIRSPEAAEAQLERFISVRHEKRVASEGERQAEELWKESARRHAAQLREAARAEWSLYHEHMSELPARLSQEHAEKAESLRGAA